jgi:hypothetical protein|tara:strand:- start:2079 stop:2726 length:648 start_codon:yes stop_codon:yes gene_type:complete
MGLFGNNNAQQNGALSLGVNGQTNTQSNFVNPFAPPQQQQNFAQNNMAQGFMGGMGMSQNQMGMMGQPMAPPSEAEIQLALMKTLAPMDRFIGSAQMGTMLQLLNDLVSFSVLEILKGATFVINEDEGTMKMDIASLPSNLQTMSAENVTGQFSSLQMASQQNIQQAEMQQQQIAALAQQSMMGGALSAAMQDESLMNKAGGAAGNFMGRMMGMR